MSCDARDQDLLLLIHGELPPLRRGLTRMHLRRCPRCRERQEQLCAVSHLLADTLRGWNALPCPGASPAARTPLPASPLRIRRQLLVSLVFLMTLLSLMAFAHTVRSLRTADGNTPGTRQPKAPDDGCRPDLSNDHCR